MSLSINRVRATRRSSFNLVYISTDWLFLSLKSTIPALLGATGEKDSLSPPVING
jgi:hypothetical protein